MLNQRIVESKDCLIKGVLDQRIVEGLFKEVIRRPWFWGSCQGFRRLAGDQGSRRFSGGQGTRWGAGGQGLEVITRLSAREVAWW